MNIPMKLQKAQRNQVCLLSNFAKTMQWSPTYGYTAVTNLRYPIKLIVFFFLRITGLIFFSEMGNYG